MTAAHVTRVEGDYLSGWRWHCSCGSASTVYGEAAAPKRAAASHVRHHRAKAAA